MSKNATFNPQVSSMQDYSIIDMVKLVVMFITDSYKIYYTFCCNP